MKYSKEGSLWHKWDLHIHTDASDGKSTCQEILTAALDKQIKCIAVTDHHTVDNIDIMKSLAASMEISVISGVEFRTEYGNSSVHIIGLFPDEHNGVRLDMNFLKENVLNQLGISRTKIIQKGKECLKTEGLPDDTYFKHGMFQVQVDFKNAANLIHEYGGLVTVHAGNRSNGIEKEMKHDGSSPKNVSIENSLGPVKEELFREGYIDICDITKSTDASFYRKEFNTPSITTSDAHTAQDVGKNACWIKADLTFEGLKQILIEPERISFEEPEILIRIKRNPDKFIKALNINRSATATMSEIWFDKIQIPINPGLVAIIGNKGSGKSAITDIISLCADTTNQKWAFLTQSKYRMPKPYNRSKQTEAYIQWYDNSRSTIKSLDLESDLTQPERVKYIPQNFLESLCTTEDDQEFESELKKIIFQYLDPAQRYGLNDLDSIIEYLTKEISASCIQTQQKIKAINREIIALETMLNPEYRSKLANSLKYKQEQLTNTQSSKPKEVSKPSLENNPEALKIQEEIEKNQAECKILKSELETLVKRREEIIKSKQDIKIGQARIERVKDDIESIKIELRQAFNKINLDIDSIINISYRQELIESKINEFNILINQIEKQLDPLETNSQKYKYDKLVLQLEEAKKKQSEPEQEYHKYLKQKEEWEKMIEDIVGDPQKEGSIKNLQANIDYIDHQLLNDLSTKKKLRYEFALELMQKKIKVLETYNALFYPIVKFIQDFHEELKDYPIEFDSTFSIRNFEDKFFDCISQQVAGSYYGKEQGLNRIKENIDKIDVSDIKSIVEFACSINEDLQIDKRENQNVNRIVETQLKKGHSVQDLYDYIYSMEYIVPFFQLKMNGKPLSSLSPGERGALLLLLYLFIDMDDKPLIIDQPEENLDNESVFKYLVHFIKAAKRKRQIIIVTHNPNLAVVCDADQIIQMKIDKLNGNKVTYETGSIENPKINRIIVDILEGTYPAFHNRDCKYFDKKLEK